MKANPTNQPGNDDQHWWPRLIDHVNAWWMDRRPTGPALRQALRIPPPRAAALLVAALTLTLAVAGLLVWWLVNALVHLVVGVATGIRDTTTAGAAAGRHHAAGWAMTRTITAPVRTYISHHAAGLPVSAHTLWLTWWATTAVMFAFAVAGSRGARLGWVITGAATTAMVYAGTPAPGRPVAAGLALTVWAVLSIPAFNRLLPAPNTPDLPTPTRRSHPDVDTRAGTD